MRSDEEKGKTRDDCRKRAQAAIGQLKDKNNAQYDVPRQEAIVYAALAEALENAVQDLVDASSDNTKTMAQLQEKIVALTSTYVRLTRWMVGLTAAVALMAIVSGIAAAMQGYRAIRPSSPTVIVRPVPVSFVASPAATSPSPPSRAVGSEDRRPIDGKLK
jgi:hypothetical protein